MTAAPDDTRGKAGFYGFVGAQAISQIGSTLTSFGVGLWVLEQTARLTDFAWVAVVSTVPVILLAPVNGLLIDRLPRRKLFLATQLGPAACALVALVLFLHGHFALWHALVLNAVNGAFNALNSPAMSATISRLVPREGLVRANGVFGASMALPGLIAPAAAGIVMARAGMAGVLALDLATYVVAVALLSRLQMPTLQGLPPTASTAPTIDVRSARAGLHYVLQTPRLLAFMAAVGTAQLSGACLAVLALPLLRSLGGVDTLGITLTVSSLGALLGALALAAKGRASRRVASVAGFALLQGLFIAGIGLRPSLWVVAPALFGANASVAALSACSESILQERIPKALHGRVFALRGMFLGITGMVLSVLLGVLSDKVFEPFMRTESELSLIFGRVIGFGAGRGTALLVMLVGAICVVCAVLVRHPALSRLDQPDQPDQPDQHDEHDEAVIPELPASAEPWA